MKFVIFLAAVFTLHTTFAQTPVIVAPAPQQTLDIVLTPFGIDNPIKVGIVEKTGNGFVNTDIDFGLLAKTKHDNYTLTINELLDFCDDADEIFGRDQNLDALELSPYFLMNNNEVAGFITLVSDTAVANWVNGPEYGEPVLGSWFEPIYISASFSYKGMCTKVLSIDSGGVETVYEMDIKLLAGLNFLEFKVESIYEGNGEGMNSNAKKIIVTAHQKIPLNTIMIAHYY